MSDKPKYISRYDTSAPLLTRWRRRLFGLNEAEVAINRSYAIECYILEQRKHQAIYPPWHEFFKTHPAGAPDFLEKFEEYFDANCPDALRFNERSMILRLREEMAEERCSPSKICKDEDGMTQGCPNCLPAMSVCPWYKK